MLNMGFKEEIDEILSGDAGKQADLAVFRHHAGGSPPDSNQYMGKTFFELSPLTQYRQ